ncbi:MAG: metal ABC transporter substrate-binding protein [Nitrospiria bacterium]
MNRIRLLLIPIFFLQVSAAGAKTVRVVTTTEDLAAITREIGGDRVSVDFIAKGVQDPHFIDAKPSYLLKLSRADLFVEIGLGLESGWAPLLLSGARNGRIQPGNIGYVRAADGIALLEVPSGRIDRSGGDVHAEGNPHYWLDPANGKVIALNIADGLMRIDPEGKAVYKQNLERFAERLDAALSRWGAGMEPFKGERVVTYHNSWPYFLKRFGLQAVDYVEPKPGIPPASTHLKQLIERIQAEGVKIIIAEPYFDRKVPQFLAEQSGATLVVLPPSVSTGGGIEDYFQLFDHLIDNLAKAFKESGVQ